MKKLLLTALLVTGSYSVSAADAPAAPAKEAICRTCHGVNGAKPIMAKYPKLNGQNKEYLIDSIKAYKAGNRKGGLSAVMVAQSSALSDAEIEALADYYSKQ